MNFLIFAKNLFIWHYGRAIKEGFIIWKNFLWFIFNLFSISLLLKTLFKPWRRMRDYYGRAFDPQRYFETLALNLIMRCVGLVIRLATIFIGLVFEIGVLMLGAVAFVIWIFLPLIVFSCFFKGISLIL